MRTPLSEIALAASIGLALAFTLSCSSDGGGNTQHTYYYSWYGVTSCSALDALASEYNLTDKSFQNVRETWSKVLQLDGGFIESGIGWTEANIKKYFVEHNGIPKEVDEMIEKLKSRGNTLQAFSSSDYRYCSDVLYLEQE